MNCHDARVLLVDLRRRRLPPALEAEVRAHLEACQACSRADAAEQALDDVLRRLPRHAAPAALKKRLALRYAPPPAARRPGPWRLRRMLAPALAAGFALLSAALLVDRAQTSRADAFGRLTDEAVSDYLRVVASQHPLDVESGGTHQVKPWFEGRLDFAPVVPEDPDLRLQGGSVGYVLDRKAAVLVYALRRHTVTLLAFRAEGLPLGDAGPRPAPERRASRRGFHVVFWRSGDLGYALVSDADAAELGTIATRLAARTTQPAR